MRKRETERGGEREGERQRERQKEGGVSPIHVLLKLYALERFIC